MRYALGERSLSRLEGVHPKLVAVVKAAILVSAVDFTVVEGVRTKATMWENYGKGRSAAECVAHHVPAECAQPKLSKVTWLNDPLGSLHGVQADGFGHAVDLAPFIDGAIAWDDEAAFARINDAMTGAAVARSTPITWGGTWKTPDRPHFELQAPGSSVA